VNAAELLPLLWDLFSKHPEMRDLEAWELQHVLWTLGYTDDLEDEGEIAAAVEVAKTDWTGAAA
jgi:hypothetical protein